jgi:hypothetical protein
MSQEAEILFEARCKNMNLSWWLNLIGFSLNIVSSLFLIYHAKGETTFQDITDLNKHTRRAVGLIILGSSSQMAAFILGQY